MKNLPTPTLRTLTGGTLTPGSDGGIYCPFPKSTNGIDGGYPGAPESTDGTGVWSGSQPSTVS